MNSEGTKGKGRRPIRRVLSAASASGVGDSRWGSGSPSWGLLRGGLAWRQLLCKSLRSFRRVLHEPEPHLLRPQPPDPAPSPEQTPSECLNTESDIALREGESPPCQALCRAPSLSCPTCPSPQPQGGVGSATFKFMWGTRKTKAPKDLVQCRSANTQQSQVSDSVCPTPVGEWM